MNVRISFWFMVVVILFCISDIYAQNPILIYPNTSEISTLTTAFSKTNVADGDRIMPHPHSREVTYLDTMICENDLPFFWNGYTFTQAGSHTTTMSASDGSDSVILMSLTVSAQAVGEVTGNTVVCAGSTTQLSYAGLITRLSVNDTIFLPDGVSCEPYGCSYLSPVTFNTFAQGQTLTNPSDILYVRIKLEHSYVGDIYIRLVCPNNNSTAILRKYGLGYSSCLSQIPSSDIGWNTNMTYQSSADFGISNSTGSGSGNACTPSQMGTGWNYCWSNNSNLGYEYANGNSLVYQSVNIHNNRIDSTNVATMTNVYHPDESFANLAGCPLNGTWSIEVIDGWSGDNGYIFDWELALNPNLLNLHWSATCTGPFIDTIYNFVDSLINVVITPPVGTPSGYYDYVFVITNNAGCTDTIVEQLFVAPIVNTVFYDSVCAASPYNHHGFSFSANYVNYLMNGQTVPTVHEFTRSYPSASGCDSTVTLHLTINPNSYSTVQQTITPNEIPYIWNGVTFTSAGTRMATIPNCYGCDSVITMQLTILNNTYQTIDSSVCINQLPFNWGDDLFIAAGTFYDTLLNADGSHLILTKNLSVNSLPTISFTGFTNPVCLFDADSIVLNALVSNGLSPYSYIWSGNGISSASDNHASFRFAEINCGEQLNILLSVSDANGCRKTDSTVLNFQDEILPTLGTISNQSANVSNCIFTVPDFLDLVRTLSSDNCTPRDSLLISQQPTAGTPITTATIVTVTVTDKCGNQTTTQIAVNVPNPLSITITNITHIECYGESNGSVTLEVTDGITPYTYQWSNTLAPNTVIANTAVLSAQPSGTYSVTITDANGCTNSQNVTLNTLYGEMNAGVIIGNQSLCYGENVPSLTGTAASGGNNSVYQWQSSVDNLIFSPVGEPNNQQNYLVGTATETRYYRRAWICNTCGTVYSDTLLITVFPIYHDTIEDAVCQNYPYNENGFDISADETANAGLLVRTNILRTTFDCDSLVTLLLTVNSEVEIEELINLCEPELPYFYAARDTTFEEGTPPISTHTFRYSTTFGCDSIIHLTLFVNPTYETDEMLTICEEDLPFYYATGDTVFKVGTEGESTHNFLLTTAAGCDSLVNLHLSVIEMSLQIVNVGADFCDNYTTTLAVNTNMSDYVWNTGEISSEITVTESGNYSVSATEENCVATAHYKIAVCDFNPFLPNAISPSNNDGLNDYFYINDFAQKQISQFEIYIYNRWGDLIFKSIDKNFKWYGDHDGKTMNNSVCSYVIICYDFNGRKFIYKGNISIL